jgi:aarF domain-containing kinase
VADDENQPGSAPPTTAWGRSAQLARLAAGLARRELGGRVKRALSANDELAQRVQRVAVQLEQAKDVVKSLGALKGAAMKAGQLVSMELRDVLPPEVISVLSQLQDAGSHVPFAEIRSILLDELGASTLERLTITETPLASASIGQVHRATWRDDQGAPHQVVLKVQFRGVAESIDTDLALLQRIAKAFIATQRKDVDLGSVFTELKVVLRQETDYRHEAKSLNQYRALASTVGGLAVPTVYDSLSTQRVLGLSYEPGLKLDAYLAQRPSQVEKNAVAAQLLDLFFREFFEWGLVQTDANFANFLFRPDQRQVVLLDFGATREYPAAFREVYRRLLQASFTGDTAATYAAGLELGLIDPREGQAAQAALHHLLRTVLRVFTPEVQPFTFTNPKYVDDAGAALKAYYLALQHSAPPAQLLFLHRKLGGVYSLGRALSATVDLRPYWQRL